MGMGWRTVKASTMVNTAPVAQTTKTQLDVCRGVNPNCTDTARCSGSAPKA